MKNILKNFYHNINKNFQFEFLQKKEFSYFSNCKKILDIGCGVGNFLALSPKRIYGIDINRKSVASAVRKGLMAKYGKATSLQFDNLSFDGIHCSHVIEHLFPEDAYKLLAEVSRVLSKGGIFVISTPTLWNGFYNDFTHIKPYNPKSIERYLCEEGHEKTYAGMPYKYKKMDFYWRYETFPLPGRIGKLISNYIYKFHIHSFKKNAYTLVLKKIS